MKKLLLPLLAIFLFTTCQKDPDVVISPLEIPETEFDVAVNNADERARRRKYIVCFNERIIRVNRQQIRFYYNNGYPIDFDGDRYFHILNECSGGFDCNDFNRWINPGAEETCCNNIDENCNEQIDENCTPSVTICNQIWMLKNLDVTKYRNGDDIPEVTDGTAWANLTTGAWCYYENSSVNGAIYGKLYNWFAVNDPRGLAPEGWHIPTDSKWAAAVDCLGGIAVAGGKMKQTGTTHWTFPNSGATNSSGFTALPAGARNFHGVFGSIGVLSDWWSSTEEDAVFSWDLYLVHNNDDALRSENNKPTGFSVRCLKD